MLITQVYYDSERYWIFEMIINKEMWISNIRYNFQIQITLSV